MMFVKRGERVADEAAALAAAGGHPGVVELMGADGGVLRTRMVDGRPLAELDPLAPDEVAGVAGAVATTLADLHELGVVHGAVDAGHVLVGTDGKVVLCSLGRGGEPADDVAALGHLVARLLAGGPGDGAARSWRPVLGRRTKGAAGRRPVRAKERVRARLGLRSRLGPMLQPPAAPALAALAEHATDPDPRRRPTGRDFAAAVHQQVPTARIPLPKPRPLVPDAAVRLPAGVAGPRQSRTALTAVLFLLALAAYGGVIALVTSALSDHGRGRPPPGKVPERVGSDGAGHGAAGGAGAAAGAGYEDPTAGRADGGASGRAGAGREAPATTTPMATRVWPPERLDYAGGVLTVDGVRYALGQPGDLVAAGDWSCTGRRTLVLLRPSTGEVFAFDGWADASEPLAGRRLGRVAGASGLRAVDTDGDGCDDLELERPGRPPVHLDVPS